MQRAAKNRREQNANMQIIALNSHIGASSKWANFTVSSHDPAALLKMLEDMGGRTDI